MVKKMKKILLVFLVLVTLLGITGCKKIVGDSSKITIVTTSFPNYEFANAILEGQKTIGKTIEVVLIVPYGISSHSYDPSLADLITIKNADLFIYTSDEMEPWISDLNLPEDKSLNIYEAMSEKYEDFQALEVVSTEHHHEDEEEHENESWLKRIFEKLFPHHHHNYDPHFWTSMLYAEYMVEVIYDSLIEVIPDPDENKKIAMRENADRYITNLRILDQDFFDIVNLAAEDNRTLYFGCPFAMYYFTHRYGLEYVLTYSTCSTEIDPSLLVVVEVIEEMKEHNIKYIITKELISTDAAKTICDYTGAEMLELHSGHNISPKEAGNVTFLSIMRNNADNLAKVLSVDTTKIKNYHEIRGGEENAN